MDMSARHSTNKMIAIIILTLAAMLLMTIFALIWLVITNRSLIREQRTVVTPMIYNVPFAVSETGADTAYLRMMTLSFLALRLNVSPETVESNHDFLLSFVHPESREAFKPVLQKEATRIKANEVSASFYTHQIDIYPIAGRVDVRGELNMWIGTSKQPPEAKKYRLKLDYAGGFTRIVQFHEVPHET